MKIQRKILIDCNEVQEVCNFQLGKVYKDDYDTYYFVTYNDVVFAIVRNATKDQIEFNEVSEI